MKANELRIGNWYNLKNDECVPMILTQDDYMKGDFFFEKLIEPIPLTEELWDKISEDEFILADKSGFVIFKNDHAYQFIYPDYPYVHQIQNLYLALRGEELELKK